MLTIPAELRQLSWFADKLGCEDPIKYLEELSWVDIERLRQVGEQVWGADGRDSEATRALERHADQLNEWLLTSVQDRWEGDAYQRFEAYMKVVEQAISDEVERLPIVGSALVSVADAFEVRWYEVIGYALAVLGLILGIAGIVVAVVTGITGVGAVVGLILGIVGLIIGVAGLLVAVCASVIPRIEAMDAAMLDLGPIGSTSTQVDRLGGDDVPGPFPGDHRQWTPITDDPAT